MSEPLILPGPLVDVSWLAAHLDHRDLRIVDASFYLPQSGKTFESEFAAARIPGARPFKVDALCRHDTDLPHMLPAPEDFSRGVGALGIGSGHTVVAYDTFGLFSVARAWWMFRIFGHQSVAVLDGGLPAWRSAGHEVESGPAGPWPDAQFTARFRPEMVRSADEVRSLAENGGAQIVDVRAAERYYGEVPEVRPGVRSGHIPGSLPLPYSNLLDPETKLFKRGEDLANTLDQAGIDRSQPVVASCGSGISACLLDLALTLSGDDGAAVYDGSWAEWGSRTDLPIASGRN